MGRITAGFYSKDWILFEAWASLGLPGLGNFVGEFLVLLGTYQVSVWLAAVASLGLIVSTVYSLWMMQRAFYGPAETPSRPADLSGREMAMMAAMMLVLLWLGIYPQPFLNTSRPPLRVIHQSSALPAQEGNARRQAAEVNSREAAAVNSQQGREPHRYTQIATGRYAFAPEGHLIIAQRFIAGNLVCLTLPHTQSVP